MSNTNFPRFVLLLSLLGFNLTLGAQVNKQVSILYNTKLVLAEVSPEGKVIRIIDDTADDLKGYVLKTQDYSLDQLDASTQPKIQRESNSNYIYAGIDPTLIYFEKGGAILSDKAIESLETTIKTLKSNPSLKLLVQTLDKYAASLLNKNRVEAVKTYLKIRGVSHENTIYEPLKGEKNLDEVKIQFINK